MSKKDKHKDTDPTKEGDVAETTQGETPELVSNESENDAVVGDDNVVEDAVNRDFKSIESENDAVDFVKQEFPHLKGKNVFVTQDKNVFEPENISSGANHAEKNNLKSFRIKV